MNVRENATKALGLKKGHRRATTVVMKVGSVLRHQGVRLEHVDDRGPFQQSKDEAASHLGFLRLSGVWEVCCWRSSQ